MGLVGAARPRHYVQRLHEVDHQAYRRFVRPAAIAGVLLYGLLRLMWDRIHVVTHFEMFDYCST